MAKKSNKAELHAQAVINILSEIGFPLGEETEFKTPLRQRRVAHVFLAVANLKPTQSFAKMAYDGDGQNHAPRTRDVINFINAY